jgi:hypothetical protein
MRVFGLVTPHGAIGGTSPLLLSGSGPLEALLPPEPVHPVVVHRRALPQQQAVRHAPSPADMLGCDFPEPLPQLGLLDIDNLAGMPLGAAASFRAQKFPSANSLSIAFFSWVSRLASSACIPPYCCFQRW